MSKQPEALLYFLQENVRYENGTLFWKTVKRGRKTGSALGSPGHHGYIRTEIEGKKYAAHRLVFLLHHGWLPEVVDHIDGNTSNNCIENLRAATVRQNTCNSRTRSDSAANAKGIHQCANSSRWRASVKFGSVRWAKYFGSKEEALEAANSKRQELHGSFARHQ